MILVVTCMKYHQEGSTRSVICAPVEFMDEILWCRLDQRHDGRREELLGKCSLLVNKFKRN